MRDQFKALMQVSDVTRLAVSIVDEGKLADIYLFGERETEAIQSNTVWTVASLTKPVFVYGVMMLVDRGLIDLDRPIQYYLPDTYTDEVFLPQMTVRHAMSHSTGFPNWRDEQGLRTGFIPGTKFSYSSEGLTFLQYAIEHIIQMPLYAYLKQQVFTPLGMNHTELKLEEPNDLPPMLHFLTGTLLANGALSLRTTIEDYARFMTAMLNTSNSDSLIDQRSLNEMLTPQIDLTGVPNLHWGLGWGLQNLTSTWSFWHWGARSIPRTMNFAMGIPNQQKAIVVFTDHANGLYLCKDIISAWIGKMTLPAFEWLLPAKEWRPDGKKHA